MLCTTETRIWVSLHGLLIAPKVDCDPRLTFSLISMEYLHAICKMLLNKIIQYYCVLFDRPPLIKIQDKVMIPQDNHPEVNFIGLLIGPR